MIFRDQEQGNRKTDRKVIAIFRWDRPKRGHGELAEKTTSKSGRRTWNRKKKNNSKTVFTHSN